MSELLNRAAAIKKAEQQLQPKDERELRRQLSLQRSSEFIELMRRGEVPSLPIYAEEVVMKHSSTGLTFDSKHPVTIGYHLIGNGWVIKEAAYDHLSDIVRNGLFLCEDGRAYDCGGVQDEAPRGLTDFPAEKYLRATYLKEKDDDSYHESYGDEAKFASTEGLDLLGESLVRYKVIEY